VSFKVDPPFPIAGRVGLAFSPTDIQFDFVHRKLYAVKQDEHNEVRADPCLVACAVCDCARVRCCTHTFFLSMHETRLWRSTW
jgi:hypothetical protein